MKTHLTILTFLIIAINSYGQGFKIQNASNSKTINKSDLVELYLGSSDSNKVCCAYQKLDGHIVSVSEDSILVKLDKMMLFHDFKKEELNSKKWTGLEKISSISKSDILYLHTYKSNSNRKLKNSLATTGGILLLTGIGTALNTFFVSDKKNKRNLLLSGGIQFGTGLIIGISSNHQKYKFKNTDNPWKFE